MALFEEQIDNATDFLERLSQRDRQLLFIASIGILLLVGCLTYLFINGQQKSQENENRYLVQKLEQILTIESQFKQARKKVITLEQQIKSNRVNLMPYLDELSQKHSINIKSMNPINVEVSENQNTNIKQKAVKIQLQGVTVASLVKFFTAIENSGKIVKIRQLKLRPNFSDPTKPDVNAVISTYLIEE